MDDPADYVHQKAEPPPDPARAPRRSPTLSFFTVAMLVALGTVAFFFARHEQPGPHSPVAAPAPAGSTVTADAPLGVAVAPIDLPPLDDSDPLVRQLLGALSSHPRVAAWLATDGLIRNFVVAVENISLGRTPTRQLRALRPGGPFRVVENDGELTVDSGSYERYVPIARAVQSIDAGDAARLYTSLKPRIEDAYRELGHQGSFDRALERAIVALLQVPIVDAGIALAPKGALYRYEEPRLEQLTDAQKQLARMGPANVRIIQDKLRDVAWQLGVPAERLGS
jgi:hypothetical protein